MASPLLGRQAPAFTGEDLTTGAPVSLSALRGHYVVVNFFASWCGPCQQEAPDLSRFHFEQAHAADGADMVSVVFHDTSSSARSFLQKNGDLWPAVSDPHGASPSATGSPRHPPPSSSVRPAASPRCSSVPPPRRTSTHRSRRPGPSSPERAVAERTVAPPAVGAGRAAARRPVVALVIGSGALHSSPPTDGQRVAALEAGVRCPSCTDLSVSQSNATTAIAVRHQIESMVAAGRSDAASTRRSSPSTARPSFSSHPTPAVSR